MYVSYFRFLVQQNYDFIYFVDIEVFRYYFCDRKIFGSVPFNDIKALRQPPHPPPPPLKLTKTFSNGLNSKKFSPRIITREKSWLMIDNYSKKTWHKDNHLKKS